MLRALVPLILTAAVLLPTTATACDDPFGCGPSSPAPHSRHARKLTVAAAKAETRRQMWIEASSWDYQRFVMTNGPGCRRVSGTRMNCRFTIYQRLDYSNGGPADPRSCDYVAHVWLPKTSSKPRSTVEHLGCRTG